MRRLDLLPCPVPDALTLARAAVRVLVVALAGCANMDALAPPLSPIVTVDSEPPLECKAT